MSKFLFAFLIFFCGFSAISATTDELFEKALYSDGEDYCAQKNSFVNSAGREALLNFLDAKLKDEKAGILSRALAAILKEYIEKKERVDDFNGYGVTSSGPALRTLNGSYPEAYEKLILEKYRSCDCPYSIMEGMWKLMDPDYKKGNRKVLLIHHQEIIAKAGQLPELFKEMYVGILKNKLVHIPAGTAHRILPATGDPVARDLVTLAPSGSFQDIYAWVNNMKYSYKMGYATQYFPVTAKKDDLPLLEEYYSNSANWKYPRGDLFKKRFAVFLDFLKSGNPPDDDWIKAFVDASRSYLPSDPSVETVRRLRPDLQDRVVIDASGHLTIKPAPLK